MDEDQHVVGDGWLVRCWGDAAERKGTCNHLNDAYVALCRCAGINARILNFNVQFGDTAQEVLTPDPILSSFMNNSGGVIPETEAEVLIDGAWTPAYIPQNILLTACSRWPISELGESCLNLYYDIIPGSLHHVEGISFKSVMMHRLLSKFAPATQERLNVKFQEMQTLGRTILDIQGGVEGHNRITRPLVGSISKEEVLTLWKNQRLKPQ